MYEYTVENRQTKSGVPLKTSTLYPLNVGMYTQLNTKDGMVVVKVVEILMYNDEAVIVVEN